MVINKILQSDGDERSYLHALIDEMLDSAVTEGRLWLPTPDCGVLLFTIKRINDDKIL